MKKVLSFLCVLPVLFAVLPVCPLSAEASELKVTWNLGYVGSMGNALGNENTLGSLGNPGTTYRHTDVVRIEKAGTTVWFRERGSGNSGFCARTGYSISSWKEMNGVYVLDTEGANYPGTDGATIGIAERSGDTITYTYTTSRDNELLRFCFCITNDKDASGNVIFPTIYSEYTGLPGTFAEQCAADSAPVSFEPDSTITGFNWFYGYVGSAYNDLFYVNEIRPYYTEYSYTGIITVPAAGTTISFSDAAFPFVDKTVYTISSWKPAGQTWVLDTAGANFTGDDLSVISNENGNYTYSYTTERDNEHLRLCLRTGGSGTLPTVTWDAPEGTYNNESSEETQPEETEPPAIVFNPLTEGDTAGDLPGDSSGIAPKIALGFTGAAYFAGYMIFKRRPGEKKARQGKTDENK